MYRPGVMVLLRKAEDVAQIPKTDGAVRGILPAMRTYTVSCEWDADAEVWYVENSDVPGLVTEAPTFEALELKLRRMIPELLELNVGLPPHQEIPFELITRKHELARFA